MWISCDHRIICPYWLPVLRRICTCQRNWHDFFPCHCPGKMKWWKLVLAVQYQTKEWYFCTTFHNGELVYKQSFDLWNLFMRYSNWKVDGYNRPYILVLFSDPLRSPSFWYRQAIYFDLKAHPTSLVSTVIIDDNWKTQPESPNQYYMIERFGRSSWVELYIKRVYLLLVSLCISISSIVKIFWVFWVVVPRLYDSTLSKNNANKTKHLCLYEYDLWSSVWLYDSFQGA